MKKWDMFIILMALGLSLAIWGVFQVVKDSDNLRTVEIKSEGQVITTLEVDATSSASYTVSNQYGTNHIIIDKGLIWVDEASCLNQVCVDHPPIAYPGQSIVCLPNRVIVQVKGKKKNDLVDDVSY